MFRRCCCSFCCFFAALRWSTYLVLGEMLWSSMIISMGMPTCTSRPHETLTWAGGWAHRDSFRAAGKFKCLQVLPHIGDFETQVIHSSSVQLSRSLPSCPVHSETANRCSVLLTVWVRARVGASADNQMMFSFIDAGLGGRVASALLLQWYASSVYLPEISRNEIRYDVINISDFYSGLLVDMLIVIRSESIPSRTAEAYHCWAMTSVMASISINFCDILWCPGCHRSQTTQTFPLLHYNNIPITL